MSHQEWPTKYIPFSEYITNELPLWRLMAIWEPLVRAPDSGGAKIRARPSAYVYISNFIHGSLDYELGNPAR